MLQNHKLQGSSPWRNSRATCPPQKHQPCVLAHLEEEDAGRDEDKERSDLSEIEGVTEEFMVHLARAVNDAQMKEKHCYHYSSPEHFIHNCLLVKTLRENAQLKSKEGMTLKKGAWIPLTTVNTMKNLQMEAPKM